MSSCYDSDNRLPISEYILILIGSLLAGIMTRSSVVWRGVIIFKFKREILVFIANYAYFGHLIN
jgi:hypothetical protein